MRRQRSKRRRRRIDRGGAAKLKRIAKQANSNLSLSLWSFQESALSSKDEETGTRRRKEERRPKETTTVANRTNNAAEATSVPTRTVFVRSNRRRGKFK